ncbi:MAG: putative molybdenum carrier protein [Kofleriaceae bacterium]
MLFIIHSGQTGVERGAHDAAQMCGVGIAGFMPRDRRDELGPLPSNVAARLTWFSEKGQRPAIRANLTIASAALLVVPDAARAEQFPALGWVIQSVRASRLPLMVCDPSTSVADVSAWFADTPRTCGSRRLAVIGPRATRWQQGEVIARRIVCALAAGQDRDVPIGRAKRVQVRL